MLLGNFYPFNSNPGKEVGGPSNSSAWLKNGSMQKWFYGEGSILGQTERSGFPSGYLPPGSFVLPPKTGGISSRYNGRTTFSSTSNLVGGRNGEGSATITFTTTATGGLIVSAIGSATITFSTTAVLNSVASASGSATITFSGSALLGAQAGLSGSSTITFSGTAESYAIGYMSGLSTNETEFSAAALADAVWNALLTDYDLAGSFGEAMAAAGSAGDPWITPLPGAYADGTAGKIVGEKLLRLTKFLALK